MKDSLDILRTDYSTDDSIEHHGVKGMKWGHRKQYDTQNVTKSVNSNERRTGRKKNVTQGNGKGAHRRGEGMHLESGWNMTTGDINMGVGQEDSYFNSVTTGKGQAPISVQLGQALWYAVEQEIRQSEEYKNILKLAEEFKKLAETRSKYQNQGSTAATMVFEEKASKLIREINSNLSELDSKYYDKTKMINQAAHLGKTGATENNYKPSKSILDGLQYQLGSTGLSVDKSGRVGKGWKETPTTSNSKTGWSYKKTSK